MSSSSVNLKIKGMSCQNCVNSIQAILQQTTGISKTVVNLSDENATINFDCNAINPDRIAKIIEDTGFDPVLYYRPKKNLKV